MNQNIDLVEILKDCPKGTKLYTPLAGEVVFYEIEEEDHFPIRVKFDKDGLTETLWFAKDGRFLYPSYGECILFPSKDQRDWSKLKPKKPKFGPKTLQTFDWVLVCDGYSKWSVSFFSYYDNEKKISICSNYSAWKYCIPYNQETKHLVGGTTDEAPEYYRYWEE